jgi:hypothetical protein
MKIPGFSAEASLHSRQKSYRAKSFHSPNNRLYPAYADWPGGWEWGATDLGSLDTESTRTYGTVPRGKEDAFVACMSQCRKNGGTNSGCQRSCCKQFTNNYACVIS